MDSTERKVHALLHHGIARAYGHDPYAPQPDDRDAPCATCEHRFDEHTGDEWEGPCAAVGCSCAGFVPLRT
jgi:hypothetical protein